MADNLPIRPSQLALLAALAWVAACGGEKKVICPAGYSAQGIYCYPNKPAGGGDTASDVAVDTNTPVFDASSDGEGADPDGALPDGLPADSVTSDGGTSDGGTSDGAAADSVVPDTSPKDTGGGGQSPIGASCSDGLDCKSGLECFAWPGGYCTVPGCGASTPCPGSAVCWGASAQSQVCAAGCEFAGDCRVAEGYGCKRLAQAWGGVDAQLCLPGGKGKVGLTCSNPLDCEGEMTCITDMPGGYCARVGCGKSDPCSAGAACVLRDGKPLCLKVCETNTDCQVGAGIPRTCAARTDLAKNPVKVCLDTATAAPVGGECLADLDCQSGKCTLVAKGTCQVGGQPCLTDGQCGANGPCEQAKEKEKGVCTQPCNKDLACPLGSLCVPGSDGATGSCATNCKGPGDADSCKVPGTECVFGVPIAPPGGKSTPGYACAARPAGSPGASCLTSAECPGGSCFTNVAKTSGYCQLPCGPAQACPYGTVCVDSGIALCERICSVDYDCPVQMVCGAGTPHKTCTQP